jgi:SAM-dependent methyltransferase
MATMYDGRNKKLRGTRGRIFGRRRKDYAGVLVHRRYWLALIVVLGATVLYSKRLRAYLKQASANVRAFDLPSAGMYDALVATVLERFYARVADETATAWPRGAVLEVGSGPGRLAVRLAQEAPGVAVTGVDLSVAMVERAARRTEGAGLGERVRFEVGDVGTLPFADQEFDGVVSTLSLHHWPDPSRGLAEIHRVLKPGGEARIYDLAHWLWWPAQGGDRLAQTAAASPFGGGEVEVVRWPGSVPAFVLLRLRREQEADS